MKSSKKISFIFILLVTFMFLFLQYNYATAQNWANLLPYDVLWSLFPPTLSPINPITGIQSPFIPPWPASPILRSSQILLPGGGGGAVAAPTIITTNWSGSWYSLLNNNTSGLMNLTLTENFTTGIIDGTVWFVLNRLVPVPTSVSGTYTGVGTAFILSGVYTDFQLAFGGLILLPIDYYITLEGEIIGGTLLVGSYSIENIQQSDFGGFNLNAI